MATITTSKTTTTSKPTSSPSTSTQPKPERNPIIERALRQSGSGSAGSYSVDSGGTKVVQLGGGGKTVIESSGIKTYISPTGENVKGVVTSGNVPVIQTSTTGQQYFLTQEQLKQEQIKNQQIGTLKENLRLSQNYPTRSYDTSYGSTIIEYTRDNKKGFIEVQPTVRSSQIQFQDRTGISMDTVGLKTLSYGYVKGEERQGRKPIINPTMFPKLKEEGIIKTEETKKPGQLGDIISLNKILPYKSELEKESSYSKFTSSFNSELEKNILSKNIFYKSAISFGLKQTNKDYSNFRYSLNRMANLRQEKFLAMPELKFSEAPLYETTRVTGKFFGGEFSKFTEKPLIYAGEQYAFYKAFQVAGFIGSKALMKTTTASSFIAPKIIGGLTSTFNAPKSLAIKSIGLSKNIFKPMGSITAKKTSNYLIGAGFVGVNIAQNPQEFLKPQGYINLGTQLGYYGLMFKGFEKFDKAAFSGFVTEKYNLPEKTFSTVTTNRPSYIEKSNIFSEKFYRFGTYEKSINLFGKTFTYEKIPIRQTISLRGITNVKGFDIVKEKGTLRESIIETIKTGKLTKGGINILTKTNLNIKSTMKSLNIISSKGFATGSTYFIGKKVSSFKKELEVPSYRVSNIRQQAAESFLSFPKVNGIIQEPIRNELVAKAIYYKNKVVSGKKYESYTQPLKLFEKPKIKLSFEKGSYGYYSPITNEIGLSPIRYLAYKLGIKTNTFRHEMYHFYTQQLGKDKGFINEFNKMFFENKSKQSYFNPKSKYFKELGILENKYNTFKNYFEDYNKDITRISEEYLAQTSAQSPKIRKQYLPNLNKFIEQQLGIQPKKIYLKQQGESQIESLIRTYPKQTTLIEDNIFGLKQRKGSIFIDEKSAFNYKIGIYNVGIIGKGFGVGKKVGESIQIKGDTNLRIFSDIGQSFGTQTTVGVSAAKGNKLFGRTTTKTQLGLGGGLVDVSVQLGRYRGTIINPEITRGELFIGERRLGKQSNYIFGKEYKFLTLKESLPEYTKEIFLTKGISQATRKPIKSNIIFVSDKGYKPIGTITSNKAISNEKLYSLKVQEQKLEPQLSNLISQTTLKSVAKQQVKISILKSGISKVFGKTSFNLPKIKSQSKAYLVKPFASNNKIQNLNIFKNITSTKTNPTVKSISRNINTNIFKNITSNITSSSLTTKQSEINKQISQQSSQIIITPTIITPPGYKSEISFKPIIPPPLPPPPFIIYNKPIYQTKKKKPKKLNRSKRKFGYTASVQAVEFNIFGKQPKRLSGVELRPLLKKFKPVRF